MAGRSAGWNVIPIHEATAGGQEVAATDDHLYALGLSLANLLMAIDLADRETDEERRGKKHNVVNKKWGVLRDAFEGDLRRYVDADLTQREPDLRTVESALVAVDADWANDRDRTLLVDLSMGDPFAPYELEVKDDDTEEALRRVARAIGLTSQDVDEIIDTREQAIRSHRSLNWRKILKYGLAGTVLVAAGGWILAPALAGALGAAAGLSGAAATAHGLALLGGGTVAAGGLGMAGGMWVVAGGGALMGAVAGSGGQALLELGASQARVELIKLQMSYKLNLLHTQAHVAKAQKVIAELDQAYDEVQEQLEEERRLNDVNSKRVKEIEKTLEAIETAKKWVETEEAEAA